MGFWGRDMRKKCTRCGLAKDRDELGRNTKTSDGMSVYCKACKREIGKEGYRRKRAAAGFEVRPREVLPPRIKHCSRCRELKLVADFHRQSTQSGGYATYCKECRRGIG